MTEWQTIETAPKDGTRVRLAHEQDKSSMKVDGIFQTIGQFNGRAWELNSFFVIPGGRYGHMSYSPTHWMPLPLPPKEIK